MSETPPASGEGGYVAGGLRNPYKLYVSDLLDIRGIGCGCWQRLYAGRRRAPPTPAAVKVGPRSETRNADKGRDVRPEDRCTPDDWRRAGMVRSIDVKGVCVLPQNRVSPRYFTYRMHKMTAPFRQPRPPRLPHANLSNPACIHPAGHKPVYMRNFFPSPWEEPKATELCRIRHRHQQGTEGSQESSPTAILREKQPARQRAGHVRAYPEHPSNSYTIHAYGVVLQEQRFRRAKDHPNLKHNQRAQVLKLMRCARTIFQVISTFHSQHPSTQERIRQGEEAQRPAMPSLPF